MPIYKDVTPLEVVACTVPKDGTFADGVDFVLEKLDSIAPADVEPVHYAHLILHSEFHSCISHYLECSYCHKQFTYLENKGLFAAFYTKTDEYSRCSKCGAIIREEKVGERIS